MISNTFSRYNSEATDTNFISAGAQRTYCTHANGFVAFKNRAAKEQVTIDEIGSLPYSYVMHKIISRGALLVSMQSKQHTLQPADKTMFGVDESFA